MKRNFTDAFENQRIDEILQVINSPDFNAAEVGLDSIILALKLAIESKNMELFDAIVNNKNIPPLQFDDNWFETQLKSKNYEMLKKLLSYNKLSIQDLSFSMPLRLWDLSLLKAQGFNSEDEKQIRTIIKIILSKEQLCDARVDAVLRNFLKQGDLEGVLLSLPHIKYMHENRRLVYKTFITMRFIECIKNKQPHIFMMLAAEIDVPEELRQYHESLLPIYEALKLNPDDKEQVQNFFKNYHNLDLIEGAHNLASLRATKNDILKEGIPGIGFDNSMIVFEMLSEVNPKLIWHILESYEAPTEDIKGIELSAQCKAYLNNVIKLKTINDTLEARHQRG